MAVLPLPVIGVCDTAQFDRLPLRGERARAIRASLALLRQPYPQGINTSHGDIRVHEAGDPADHAFKWRNDEDEQQGIAELRFVIYRDERGQYKQHGPY